MSCRGLYPSSSCAPCPPEQNHAPGLGQPPARLSPAPTAGGLVIRACSGHDLCLRRETKRNILFAEGPTGGRTTISMSGIRMRRAWEGAGTAPPRKARVLRKRASAIYPELDSAGGLGGLSLIGRADGGWRHHSPPVLSLVNSLTISFSCRNVRLWHALQRPFERWGSSCFWQDRQP